MLKIFSFVVLALTFPKPTLVKLEQVKYRAVTYASVFEMFAVSVIFSLSANALIHPKKIKIFFIITYTKITSERKQTLVE